MLVEEVLGTLSSVAMDGDDSLLFKTVDGIDDPLPGEVSRLLEMSQTDDPAEGLMAPAPLDDGEYQLILSSTQARADEGIEDVVSYLPVAPLLLRVNFRL